jgi:hypothetical protein
MIAGSHDEAVMDDVATYSCVGPIEPEGDRAPRLGRFAEHECPYVNGAQSSCAEHLTMGGMSYAYDHCFDAFGACPVYRQLAAGVDDVDLVVGEGIQAWRARRPQWVQVTVGRKSA